MMRRINNSRRRLLLGLQHSGVDSRTRNKKQRVQSVDVVSSSSRDDDNDIDDDDKADVVLTLLGLPMTLRLDIWNFLGETQEEMRTLTVISKQLYKDIKQSSIEWPEFIPLIEISPTKGGSTKQLIKSLTQRQRNGQTTPYRTMKVNTTHKFDDSYGKFTNITMHRITSLIISSLHTGTACIGKCYNLPYYLACMLPNLLEIDLSNTVYEFHEGYYHAGSGSVIQGFTKNCHRLEKITWNNVRTTNSNDRGFIYLDGISMRHADNLRVIHMDNSDFCSGYQDCFQHYMWDLNNLPDIFIFHECYKSLERVSLRNARNKNDKTPIEQEALIKFVRSVPTLRWFRSDLRQENINLLTKERPDIEFC